MDALTFVRRLREKGPKWQFMATNSMYYPVPKDMTGNNPQFKSFLEMTGLTAQEVMDGIESMKREQPEFISTGHQIYWVWDFEVPQKMWESLPAR